MKYIIRFLSFIKEIHETLVLKESVGMSAAVEPLCECPLGIIQNTRTPIRPNHHILDQPTDLLRASTLLMQPTHPPCTCLQTMFDCPCGKMFPALAPVFHKITTKCTFLK